MFYLALTRRVDAGFFTTDQPLRKEAEQLGIRVFVIAA
jgi:predicted DNA-binding protein (UPF0278 family)